MQHTLPQRVGERGVRDDKNAGIHEQVKRLTQMRKRQL